MAKLNCILDQLDPTDTSSILHLAGADFTLFSAAHGAFSRANDEVHHKTSPSKFEIIEIMSSLLSGCNAIKPKINKKKKKEL